MANYKEPIIIFQRNVHDSTIKLTKREGSIIKDEIKARISTSFPWFCTRLEIKPSNFYAIMSGERQCTLEQLNRILSGAGLTILLKQEIVIVESVSGTNANNAPYLEQDAESPFDEMADLDQYD